MAPSQKKPVRMRPSRASATGAHPPDDDGRRRLLRDVLVRTLAVGLYDAGKSLVQALIG